MLELTQKENGSYYAESDPGENGTKKPRLSVTPEEARVLAQLVYGQAVLEIGTGLGVAARAMAKTARLVTTYDIDPWVQAQVFPTLDGVRTIANLGAVSTDKFDVVFIDGAHDQASVTADMAIAQQLAKPRGLLVLHDHKMSGVQKALVQLGITPLVIPTTWELALVFLGEVE